MGKKEKKKTVKKEPGAGATKKQDSWVPSLSTSSGRQIKEKTDYKSFLNERIRSVVDLNEYSPFDVLGPHLLKYNKELVINCFYPNAKEIRIKRKDDPASPLGTPAQEETIMNLVDTAGFFQAVFGDIKEVFGYTVIITDKWNNIKETEDPYAYKTEISDFDIHLMKEGNHYKIFEKLGAKVKTVNGVEGVQFGVWAPNAQSVFVTGNFNDWETGAYFMDNVNHSGTFGLFIPGLGEGEVYKYAIKSKADGSIRMKSDPYAFQAELRPNTASVVNSLKDYEWGDDNWLEKREATDLKTAPVSVYEVHLGSWKKDYANEDFFNEWGFKNYEQLAYELVEYVKKEGYTHIELMPVMEHPYDKSWGYQVINYFAPTSRFGTPQEFMFFVDHCHKNNIGVILDWVPAHFPSDAHGLAHFDGTQLYAYQNPKKGFHKDWGTYIFDYGRNEVRNFLISNALFWFEKYHIDGLRVDAVASMIYLDYSRDDGEWEPNIYGGRENIEAVEFLKHLNETVHKYHKGVVMIAEESTAWPGVSHPVYKGGLGFDMKWNMGWMHDLLSYFSMDPVFRKFHHNKITFSLWYAFNENFMLPVSHDEVVHGKRSLLEKMPGDTWQKFANVRVFFVFMFGHPGKKLNFMTNDIGQYSEWNSESSLDWSVLDYNYNDKLNFFFSDLNRLYKQHKAFYEVDFQSEGFRWVDFSDSDNSVISFLRFSADKDEILMFVFNMTPVIREDYVFGVPHEGYYREILNSDAKEYGGSGMGNFGGVESEPVSRFEWQYSVKITLPPLGACIFVFEKTPEKELLVEVMEEMEENTV